LNDSLPTGILVAMTFRELRLASKRSRTTRPLVVRVLMALLFTFYVNYIPFHLLSERHCDDSLLSQVSAQHFEDHDDADHDDHDGHHKPHPSSEHSIQILPKAQSVTLFVAVLPAVTTVVLDVPTSLVTATFVEHIWPPGESPPEPSQPRAPPIA
jgi:hypothetical protein